MAVYAIKNLRTGSVKIGHSSRPDNRLSSLQTGNEDQLALAAICYGGGSIFEGQLHTILDGYGEHVRGEWFRGPVTNTVVTIISLMDSKLGRPAFQAMLRAMAGATDVQYLSFPSPYESANDYMMAVEITRH